MRATRKKYFRTRGKWDICGCWHCTKGWIKKAKLKKRVEDREFKKDLKENGIS